RRIIADRPRSSVSTTAPVTLVREMQAAELVAARGALADELQTAVSYDALLVRVLAIGLVHNPRLNAVVEEPHRRIELFAPISTGCQNRRLGTMRFCSSRTSISADVRPQPDV